MKIKRFDDMLNENFSNEETMLALQKYYGYYDMSNSLNIKETVIPELEKLNFYYEYDKNSNFLDIQANENQVVIVNEILTKLAKGFKGDGSNGKDTHNGVLVTPVKYY